MAKPYKNLTINRDTTISSAMKHMDTAPSKLLIVVADDKYLGLLSIGDIQRAIIRNHKLNEKISAIMRNDYIVAQPGNNLDDIKKLMLKIRAEFMPVVDENNCLVNVYFWEDLFGETKKEPLFRFNLPVVIMAGGFGTRLKPLTNVLPKPLIPINDKTFIEEIFEQFNNHGCDTFHISVNYKADLIEYYLSKQNLPYNIQYFKENRPMGTAGSLSLLTGYIKDTLFVSNCDILIDQDYSEVLKYHRENKNEITVVAAIKHYPIPYGTIETGENGRLLELIEKPEISFKINTGIYILEPQLLNEIPENEIFHMTQLIENVRKRNGRIGVFPVSEKSWKDIGSWEEYSSGIQGINRG